MRVEIDLLVHTDIGVPVMADDYDPAKDDGYTYKIRKAVFWPCGGLHSYFYLSFTTGEWVTKTERGLVSVECIMGPELRKLLDPERNMFDYSPKHPAAYGLQAAFDAEKAMDKRRLSEELKSFTSGMGGAETDDPEGSRHLQVSATMWGQIINRVEVLENENFVLKG